MGHASVERLSTANAACLLFSQLHATEFDLPWTLHAWPYAFPYPKLLRESKALLSPASVMGI